MELFADIAPRYQQSVQLPPYTTYFFQIRATGGAASDVPPDATAYAHRSANFSVVAFGSNRERHAHNPER